MPQDWKNIHRDFAYHGWAGETNYQAQWESHGFSYWATKEWIDIGLKPTDANYVAWLREQGYNALWVLNYGQDELLRKDYQQSLNTPPAKSRPWWILLLAGLLMVLVKFLLTN